MAVAMKANLSFYSSILAALFLFLAVNGRKPLMKAPEGSSTTGHYIVVLKKDSSKSDLYRVMEKVKRMSADVTVHRYTEHVGKTLTINAPDHVLEKIRHMDEISHLEEEDMAFGASVSKCDEDGINATCNSRYLWYLDRLNQVYLPLDNIVADTFNADVAVDVYILDSGIQFEHSEFENRAKYAHYDPMDEYHFTTLNTANYKPKYGRDCTGHGTLVASLIGGKTFGIAKKANLLSMRVLGCNRAAPWSVVLDGLNFIATEIEERGRPALVSMALSGTKHLSLNSAIATLHNDKKVLIVGSAGNTHSNACNSSPANNSLILRVGATNSNDSIFERSNYGPCVDIFAPGERITGAGYSCPTCVVENQSGTSLATALVAGMAAIHLSRSPLMRPADLKKKITDLSSKDVLRFNSTQASSPNRLANLDCGGSFVMPSLSQEVQISSTNFPSQYLNNLKCTWTVYAPENSNVYVQFDHIKIEEKYDQLRLCNGRTCFKDDIKLAQLSGNYGDVSCGYTSITNILTLEFTTDATTTSTGFRAKFMAENNSQLPKPLRGCQKDKSVIQLDVTSHGGSNAKNRFTMTRDWQMFFGGRRKGANIAIIDEKTGEILQTQTSSSWTGLANTIEKVQPGTLVLMANNAPYSYFLHRIDDRAKRAISTLGANLSSNVDRQSWALIGIKGLAQGKAIESFSSKYAANASTQIKLQSGRMLGVRITAISGGKEHGGNTMNITVDGKLVNTAVDNGDNIGLNVVVIDEDTGNILDIKVFDTNTEVNSDYSPTDAQGFADFMAFIPMGRIVAIAIKGNAVTGLTENAKLACESIGSRLIRRVKKDGSWAIIGRKGAMPGEVAESVKYNSKAQATFYLPVGRFESKNFSTICKISAASSTNWAGCSSSGYIGTYISVNEHTYPSNLCPGHGITISVLRENRCEFQESKIYDTYTRSSRQRYAASQELTKFINGLPDGQIVVATIGYGGTRYLQNSGKSALESIGSALIWNIGSSHAWAIIGRKGATPGSVPEIHPGLHSGAISATVPLHAPLLPSISSCSHSIYPLNCLAGMDV